MTTHPRILISKCLGFSACRYDGSIIQQDFIDELSDFVEFIPVCPEQEIGLGVPREVLRLFESEGDTRLYQPGAGKDLTETLIKFADDYFNSLNNIQGAILKNRSPSCAVKDAKIYNDKDINITKRRGPGLFGGYLLNNYPGLPIENEGRLNNLNIREKFLTNIFTLARFHYIRKNYSIKDLLDFHANHKYLFMSYSQDKMRELGRILANQNTMDKEKLFSLFEECLKDILTSQNNSGKKVNVLMHIMGYFKDKVTSNEKAFLLDAINKYQEYQLPLTVPVNILKSWAIKYKEEYLLSQYFFTPFPEELMSLKDSGKIPSN